MDRDKDFSPDDLTLSSLDPLEELENVTSPLPQTDLSSTARAFNNRIQKKKREQEIAQTSTERNAIKRQNTLFVAMSNIRRSLIDVTRVDLGDRFYFSLVADDWQGWPRLTILLKDSLVLEDEFPIFRVVAHDRLEKGTIEIQFGANNSVEIISTAETTQLQRLPTTLKRCVRAHLDAIGDLVLAVEDDKIAEEDRTHLSDKDVSNFADSKEKQKEEETLTEDLFADSQGDEIFEQLPEIDSVDELPEL